MDFDFDLSSKEEIKPLLGKILELVNEDAVTFIESRGGVHVLIEPTKVDDRFKRNFYQNIMKLPNVDQSGDQMIPCVGATQGNFIPRFITL